MSSKSIPNKHHIIRYASWTKLLKDEDLNVLGVLHTALELRDGEKYLSATWVEYFNGQPQDQFMSAVRAIRNSIDAKPKGGMAKANVGKLHELCGAKDSRIRIVTERSKANPAHAGIHRLPQDNIDLLELLAVEAFSNVVLNRDLGP